MSSWAVHELDPYDGCPAPGSANGVTFQLPPATVETANNVFRVIEEVYLDLKATGDFHMAMKNSDLFYWRYTYH